MHRFKAGSTALGGPGAPVKHEVDGWLNHHASRRARFETTCYGLAVQVHGLQPQAAESATFDSFLRSSGNGEQTDIAIEGASL